MKAWIFNLRWYLSCYDTDTDRISEGLSRQLLDSSSFPSGSKNILGILSSYWFNTTMTNQFQVFPIPLLIPENETIFFCSLFEVNSYRIFFCDLFSILSQSISVLTMLEQNGSNVDSYLRPDRLEFLKSLRSSSLFSSSMFLQMTSGDSCCVEFIAFNISLSSFL